MSRRYVGSWTLPSGNSADVYLDVATGQLACEWDDPPGPSWSAEDVAHYQAVTFFAILHAVAEATGRLVLGVEL